MLAVQVTGLNSGASFAIHARPARIRANELPMSFSLAP